MLDEQGLAAAELARRLGVGEHCLRNRRKAAQGSGAGAFPGQGRPGPADEELRRLRAEVARLAGRTRPVKKSRGLLRQPAELTFRYIAGHRGDCPASWARDAMGVSASGSRARAARPPSAADARRGAPVAAIRQVHAEVKGRSGSPRMAAEPIARGRPGPRTPWRD
jgi:transposase